MKKENNESDSRLKVRTINANKLDNDLKTISKSIA